MLFLTAKCLGVNVNFVVAIFLAGVVSETYSIFVIKADIPRGFVGAKLLPKFDVKLEHLTLCVRSKLKVVASFRHKFLDRAVLVGKTDETNVFKLTVGWPASWIHFGYPRNYFSISSWFLTRENGEPVQFLAHEWNHFCFSYDSQNNHARVTVNGENTNVNHIEPRLKDVDLPEDFLSKVYLGMCVNNRDDPCSKHAGKFADFNVWDKALSEQEMLTWTACKQDEITYGNVVDWRTTEWELWNMTKVENVSYETICNSRSPGTTIFPTPRELFSAKHMCQKFRGTVTVVKSAEQQEKMSKTFLEHSDKCLGRGTNNAYWNGYWDEPKEKSYVDVNNGEPVGDFHPWFPGEPNGERFENCGVVWPNKDKWNDEECLSLSCSFCDLATGPEIWLRGLPPRTYFDSKYAWTGELDQSSGKYTFQGYTDSELYWDESLNKWKIRLYSNDSIYATNEMEDYPFGTSNWTIYNDWGAPGERNAELSFTACNDKEFNCNDGICIDMNLRCDGKVDCYDKTDEISCEMILADSSYIKHLAPPPLEDANSTNIDVSIKIEEILNISEIDSLFTVQFRLTMEWYDPGLTFTNLKNKSQANFLSNEQKSKIWQPVMTFSNTPKKETTVNDEKTHIMVIRQEGFTSNPEQAAQNAYMFQGHENPLELSRIYSVDFICKFQLASYPFDSQTCEMICSIAEAGLPINLKGKRLEFNGPKELNEYLVTDFNLISSSERLTVTITMKRRLTNTVMTTLMPTILLCIICHCTVYYKENLFKAVVTVNLMSLLCLITMFISISNSLLKTSYVKMIDIWLFGTLCVPFTEVLMATWIEYLKDKIQFADKTLFVKKVAPEIAGKINGTEQNINSKISHNQLLLRILDFVSKKGVPVLFTIFFVVYLLIGTYAVH